MIAGGAGGALQIHGARTNRQDVRTQNVMAVLAVANIVKSSLGPVGLDKVCHCKLLFQLSLREYVDDLRCTGSGCASRFI